MTERKIPCKAEVTSVYLDRAPDLPFGHDPFAEPPPRRRSRLLNKLADNDLIEMLKSRESENVYAALDEIGRRRVKVALQKLNHMALYEEDKGIQEEAVTTIRRIGGKAAFDVLRFLIVSEHREHIEELMKLKRSDIDKWYEHEE